MAQTKIYPSTQAQVQAVQNTVDEINAKLPAPTYQAKLAAPSKTTQLITPDQGYDALSSVTVEPSALPQGVREYILRTQSTTYELEISGDIPSYACYNQPITKLTGGIVTIRDSAFFSTQITVAILKECTTLGASAFYNSPIQYADLRISSSFEAQAFRGCSSLSLLDLTSRDTPPSLGGNTFTGTNSTWKAVVKDDTVKALFSAATNWVALASHIYTIAEIEALYGDTYDNLYLQWFGQPRNEVTT